MKNILFTIFVLIFSISLFSQELHLVNEKGKTSKKFMKGDYLYIKLKQGEYLDIPAGAVDTICRMEFDEPTMAFDCNAIQGDNVQITSFNAKIMEIGETSMKIIPVSYDSLVSTNIIVRPDVYYKIKLHKELDYLDLNYEDIRMVYSPPVWRQASYLLLTVAGTASSIIGIAASIYTEKDDQGIESGYKIDVARAVISAGVGVLSVVGGRMLLKRSTKVKGFYTAQKEDRDKLSKQYKVVKFERRY
jgi:hypothetical protein